MRSRGADRLRRVAAFPSLSADTFATALQSLSRSSPPLLPSSTLRNKGLLHRLLDRTLKKGRPSRETAADHKTTEDDPVRVFEQAVLEKQDALIKSMLEKSAVEKDMGRAIHLKYKYAGILLDAGRQALLSKALKGLCQVLQSCGDEQMIQKKVLLVADLFLASTAITVEKRAAYLAQMRQFLVRDKLPLIAHQLDLCIIQLFSVHNHFKEAKSHIEACEALWQRLPDERTRKRRMESYRCIVIHAAPSDIKPVLLKDAIQFVTQHTQQWDRPLCKALARLGEERLVKEKVRHDSSLLDLELASLLGHDIRNWLTLFPKKKSTHSMLESAVFATMNSDERLAIQLIQGLRQSAAPLTGRDVCRLLKAASDCGAVNVFKVLLQGHSLQDSKPVRHAFLSTAASLNQMEDLHAMLQHCDVNQKALHCILKGFGSSRSLDMRLVRDTVDFFSAHDVPFGRVGLRSLLYQRHVSLQLEQFRALIHMMTRSRIIPDTIVWNDLSRVHPSDKMDFSLFKRGYKKFLRSRAVEEKKGLDVYLLKQLANEKRLSSRYKMDGRTK